MEFVLPLRLVPRHLVFETTNVPALLILSVVVEVVVAGFSRIVLNMTTTDNISWQSSKKTVLERNFHMFNNSFMSDITLTCEEEQHSKKHFHAHKYVLATTSPVFAAMFYGSIPTDNSRISVRDATEESLEAFLRFLYTDDCNMTPDVALKVLHLADQYDVPSLTEHCVVVLQLHLTPSNVFKFLEKSILLRLSELEEKCWNVVDCETQQAIASADFTSIAQETLVFVLQRDSLRMGEIPLFEAVMKWCIHQCAIKELDATLQNRRTVLGAAVYQLRFLLMSQEDFTRIVTANSLLTDDEVVPIYKAFSGVMTKDLNWTITKSRCTSLRFARFSRADVKAPCHNMSVLKWFSYQANEQNNNTSWHYFLKLPDRLSFTVDKKVFLHGVRLFGAKNCKYVVTLEAKYTDAKLDAGYVEVSDTYISDCDEDADLYGFDVLFHNPVSVKGYVELTASVKGSRSYYGVNGKPDACIGDISLIFADTFLPSNGTDRRQGQFYEIILSAIY